jgi:hypothetical protein
MHFFSRYLRLTEKAFLNASVRNTIAIKIANISSANLVTNSMMKTPSTASMTSV